MEQKHVCHDCKKEMKKGEECVMYSEDQSLLKCMDCYAKNAVLENYQPTEVYSRVVGYIRPVAQWNKGKQAEFGDRVEFAVAEGCGC